MSVVEMLLTKAKYTRLSGPVTVAFQKKFISGVDGKVGRGLRCL